MGWLSNIPFVMRRDLLLYSVRNNVRVEIFVSVYEAFSLFKSAARNLLVDVNVQSLFPVISRHCRKRYHLYDTLNSYKFLSIS